MKSGKLTNILLAIVSLLLLANFMVPLLRAGEAEAIGEDAISPATAATRVADNLAFDKMAGQISEAIMQIAESNRQIAGAISQHAQSQ